MGKRRAMPAAERELRSHFRGRRAGRRFTLDLKVELTNRKIAVRARTVDISRSGALFLVDDPRFLADLPGTALDPFTNRVLNHFAEGLTAHFAGDVLRRRMEIVRTTSGGLGSVGQPLLACRFTHPLTPRECKLVGLRPQAAGTDINVR